jgi:hypothetical protein
MPGAEGTIRRADTTQTGQVCARPCLAESKNPEDGRREVLPVKPLVGHDGARGAQRMIYVGGAELLRGLKRDKPPIRGRREAESAQLSTYKCQLSLSLSRQTLPNRDDRSACPQPDGLR